VLGNIKLCWNVPSFAGIYQASLEYTRLVGISQATRATACFKTSATQWNVDAAQNSKRTTHASSASRRLRPACALCLWAPPLCRAAARNQRSRHCGGWGLHIRAHYPLRAAAAEACRAVRGQGRCDLAPSCCVGHGARRRWQGWGQEAGRRGGTCRVGLPPWRAAAQSRHGSPRKVPNCSAAGACCRRGHDHCGGGAGMLCSLVRATGLGLVRWGLAVLAFGLGLARLQCLPTETGPLSGSAALRDRSFAWVWVWHRQL
jgi:hypothetical protein